MCIYIYTYITYRVRCAACPQALADMTAPPVVRRYKYENEYTHKYLLI